MSELLDVYRGNANTWECDENGHLNVRNYTVKVNEGLGVLAQKIGLGRDALAALGARLVVKDQHIRYLREFHPGAAVLGRAGVLSIEETGLRLYCEMVNFHSEGISATYNSVLALRDITTGAPVAIPDNVVAAARAHLVDLPKHAQPRSIDIEAPSVAAVNPPSLDETEAMGMTEIGIGMVGNRDCDENGRMRNELYMGRISDAVVHFSRRMRPVDTGKERSLSKYGGAVLEYRLYYHGEVSLGDVVVVRSALKHVGEKANTLAHWLFNGNTGELVCSTEAVAITLDLKERKVVAMPEDRRKHLETLVVPGVGA
jgi:acyl-CoA thioester hydrolase